MPAATQPCPSWISFEQCVLKPICNINKPEKYQGEQEFLVNMKIDVINRKINGTGD